MSSLPILAIRQAFFEHVPHADLVIAADTGSGKSTQLPLWLIEQGRKVLVIQPRRVACLALADYLSRQIESPLGEDIGYSIRFEQRYSNDCKAVFVTPGVALRWLMDGQIGDFDTVILDEFHERRIDTDLLLALLKQRKQHRLIVTSATLAADRLVDYLPATLLQAKGRLFDVAVQYLADDVRAMPQTSLVQQYFEVALQQALEKTTGDILFFLPGRKEIQQLQQQIQARFSDLKVIPLHSTVAINDRDAALAEASNDQRRVILATNVAETSLTIPGITAVIDSGLERQTQQRNGRTVLSLVPVSRASAKQRQGRAGRTCDGMVFRLWGEHAPLAGFTEPEMVREELCEMMLAAACCGADLSELQFLDPPKAKQLDVACLQLQQMKALGSDGELLQHGRRIFPLPIDSLYAHLISSMPDKNLQGAMIDLVAALSVQQKLWQLPKDQQALKALTDWQSVSCDALTLIYLLRCGRQKIPSEIAPEFSAIKEARQLSQQIRQQLNLSKIPDTIDFERNQLVMAVLQAKPELCFVRRSKRRQALGNGFSELSPARESRFAEEDEAGLVFNDFSIPGKGTRQTLTLASCIAPVTLKQICQANLGSEQLARVVIDKNRPDQPLVEVERVYAKRVIESTLKEPSAEILSDVIVQLIEQGRTFAGLFSQLIVQIKSWQLWRKLDSEHFPYEDTPAVNSFADLPVEQAARQWLGQQVADLEITSMDELALFEASDLFFNGIPKWQQEKFERSFPMQLTLAELKLEVDYQLAKKTVVIEKVSGGRKTDPARWELPKWSGWKVKFKKASRVIDVK